ncbi:hypothetical protein L195_g063606, partial [Trifolium pratense]
VGNFEIQGGEKRSIIVEERRVGDVHRNHASRIFQNTRDETTKKSTGGSEIWKNGD